MKFRKCWHRGVSLAAEISLRPHWKGPKEMQKECWNIWDKNVSRRRIAGQIVQLESNCRKSSMALLGLNEGEVWKRKEEGDWGRKWECNSKTLGSLSIDFPSLLQSTSLTNVLSSSFTLVQVCVIAQFPSYRWDNWYIFSATLGENNLLVDLEPGSVATAILCWHSLSLICSFTLLW